MSMGFTQCGSLYTPKRRAKENNTFVAAGRFMFAVDARGYTFFAKETNGKLKPTEVINEYLQDINSGLHVNNEYQLEEDCEERTVTKPREKVLQCC